MYFSEFGPWSAIFNLDISSKIYFFGMVCVFLWSCFLFIKFIRAAGTVSVIETRYLQLASIQSFAMALTSGCVANQIFNVWFAYMARVTDANPFAAFRQAWMVIQLLVFLHILLDAMRRYAWLTLAQAQAVEKN